MIASDPDPATAGLKSRDPELFELGQEVCGLAAIEGNAEADDPASAGCLDVGLKAQQRIAGLVGGQGRSAVPRGVAGFAKVQVRHAQKVGVGP